MTDEKFSPVTLTGPAIDELLQKWADTLNGFVRQNNVCTGVMIGLMVDGIRHCHFEHPIEGYTDAHLADFFKKFIDDARAEKIAADRSKLQ